MRGESLPVGGFFSEWALIPHSISKIFLCIWSEGSQRSLDGSLPCWKALACEASAAYTSITCQGFFATFLSS